MTESKLIDFTYLAEISGNDEGFIQDMINVFLEQAPEHVMNLQQSLQSKDWKAIGMNAHTLKTSLRFMGVKHQLDKVLTLETYGRDEKNLSEIPSLIGEVVQLTEEVSRQLINIRESLNG